MKIPVKLEKMFLGYRKCTVSSVTLRKTILRNIIIFLVEVELDRESKEEYLAIVARELSQHDISMKEFFIENLNKLPGIKTKKIFENLNSYGYIKYEWEYDFFRKIDEKLIIYSEMGDWAHKKKLLKDILTQVEKLEDLFLLSRHCTIQTIIYAARDEFFKRASVQEIINISEKYNFSYCYSDSYCRAIKEKIKDQNDFNFITSKAENNPTFRMKLNKELQQAKC